VAAKELLARNEALPAEAAQLFGELGAKLADKG
jgi:hypothetical protein